MLPGPLREPSDGSVVHHYGSGVSPDATTDAASDRRATLLDALHRQSRSCAHLGSPLYAALLGEIAADVATGGACGALLEPVSERPVHDAVPLRLLAVTHELALRGDAPDLARRYPSCGGAWSGAPLLPALLAALAATPNEVAAGLARNVQTNEIGRLAAVVAGCHHIGQRTGLPVRSFEVGASAGLLSMWPYARVETGATAAGDPASALRLDASWFEPPLPPLDADMRVTAVAACDVSPIDVTTEDGRRRVASFVWPDHPARRERLLAACDLARAHGLRVDRADAGDWLAEHLADPMPVGVATIVFHSIVWQYLPTTTRDALRAALSSASATARPDAPLAWLRLEPATPEHADLRLTMWTGPDVTDRADAVLAHVGYHGAPVRWLVQ